MALTLQNIIDLAAKEIGVEASGESLAPEEYTDATNLLNEMIASWDLMRINIYASVLTQYTVTGSRTTPYMLGAGGTDFGSNTTRPVSVRTAVFVYSLLRFPLEILALEQWERITEQARLGVVVDKFYYDNGYPIALCYLNPWPNNAGILELGTWEQLTQFTWTSPPTSPPTFDFPPGFQRALVLNLAVEMAPMFGRQISPALGKIAQDSMQALQGLNLPPSPGTADEARARALAAEASMPGTPQG
jgi:hypothetical protein